MRVLSASPPFRFRELRSRATRMFAARLGGAPMAAPLCLAADAAAEVAVFTL